jgi:hypothetical protein
MSDSLTQTPIVEEESNNENGEDDGADFDFDFPNNSLKCLISHSPSEIEGMHTMTFDELIEGREVPNPDNLPLVILVCNSGWGLETEANVVFVERVLRAIFDLSPDFIRIAREVDECGFNETLFSDHFDRVVGSDQFRVIREEIDGRRMDTYYMHIYALTPKYDSITPRYRYLE